MPLCSRLEEYRVRLGIDRQEMGARAGISRQTVGQIERGDYAPSVTLALKLAKLCGTTVEDLFPYQEASPETGRTGRNGRKALRNFLMIVFCGGILTGVIGGMLSAGMAERLPGSIQAAASRALALITPWGIPVSGVVLLGIAFGFYRSAGRLCARWDGEDEALADAAGEKLTYALLFSFLEMLLCFFFLSAWPLYAAWRGPAGFLTAAAEFIAAAAAIILLQRRTADQIKTMNPEKRGSAYGRNFQNKWLESCDEAERGQVFEASCRAQLATNGTCFILWLILTGLSVFIPVGLLPSFVALAIWGAAQVSYILSVIRMGKHKRG